MWFAGCLLHKYIRGLRSEVAANLEWLRENATSGQFEPELEEMGLGH
jgi:hypothetical protein